MSNFDKFSAVSSLMKGVAVSFTSDGEEIIWRSTDITQPTDSEIDAEIIRLQAEYDAQEYARKRAEQYPPLAEQLDLLWHAIDTDTLDNKDYRNKFYTMLKKVKEDNPKG